jgi:hypothetical protein
MCTGKHLREVNRHLPFYCPECLELASSSSNTAQKPEVTEQQVELGSDPDMDMDMDAGMPGMSCEVQHQPLYKTICAPIYELKLLLLSTVLAGTIDSHAVVFDGVVVQGTTHCGIIYGYAVLPVRRSMGATFDVPQRVELRVTFERECAKGKVLQMCSRVCTGCACCCLLLHVTHEALSCSPAPVLPEIFLFDKDSLAASEDPASDLSAQDLALLTYIEETEHDIMCTVCYEIRKVLQQQRVDVEKFDLVDAAQHAFLRLDRSATDCLQ